MFERSPKILNDLFPQIIWKNPHDSKIFTFDDGPDPNYSIKFAELCKKYNQQTIFFILGRKYDRILCQEILAIGAEIAWHGNEHKSFLYLSKNDLINQIQLRKKVEDSLGISINYFRFPYGRFLPFQLPIILKEIKIMMWSIQFFDYKLKKENKIFTKMQKIQNNDIVLLHDASKYANISYNALNNYFLSWNY